MESDHDAGIRPDAERRRRRTPVEETAPSPLLSSSYTGTEYVTETGTTVVGLRTADAVVMAADRRASLGGRFVTSKRQKKIDRLHPTAAVALSGAVGDIQQFVRTMQAEARLHRHRRGEDLSIPALATLAGNVLRSAQFRITSLLGGVDENGRHVFEVDAGGAMIPDEYAAGGSGMQVAYGVLERSYDPGLSVDEGRRVAARAIDSASERDTASGNGLRISTVTHEGVQSEAYASLEEVL